MGYSPLLRGRVQGLARGINVPDAQPDASGFAFVHPIFTFVRLAQRVPVRIHIDEVPEGVNLVEGLTATVQVEGYKAPTAPSPASASEQVSQAKPEGASSQIAIPTAPRAGPKTTAHSRPSAHVPTQPVSSQAAAQPVPQAVRPQVTGPAAPVHGLGQLSVSAPPWAQASAATAAADADLEALEKQMVANPPTGNAPATSANRGSGTSAEMMSSNECLGQTFDLFASQSATPASKPRIPDSIRRHERSRRRHHRTPQSPLP
jgi:hypothetical protein